MQWVCVLYGDVIRVITEDEKSSQATVASVVNRSQDDRVDTFSLIKYRRKIILVMFLISFQ